MIKVRFEDCEIYEVTGDEKEVSKFVEKYLDRIDEELDMEIPLRYGGCCMCDNDDDDYDENHDLLRDPEETMTELDTAHDKHIELAKECIADAIKKLEKNAQNKEVAAPSDDIGSYNKHVTSFNYKDRFIAEFNQLRIRMSKLKDMLNKWDDVKLDFTPSCPKELLEKQYRSMHDYYEVLKIRAHIENIDIL